MAAVIALGALEGRGVRVANTGTLGRADVPTDFAKQVMAERGLELSHWRSLPLKEALAQDPDLIVGMTREHVGRIVDDDLDLFGKTFTLKELARRCSSAGPRKKEEDLGSYLARISAGRRLIDVTGFDEVDDIQDPIGKPVEYYRDCAALITRHVEQMVSCLWPRGASEG